MPSGVTLINVRAVTLVGRGAPDVEDAFRDSGLVGEFAAANSARKTPVRTTNTPAKTGSLKNADRDADFFFMDAAMLILGLRGPEEAKNLAGEVLRLIQIRCGDAEF
jgi:hypothetical protein